MTLIYLDFDYSEDSQGHGSFDAMACVAPTHVPAVEAEVMRVLGWAHGEFGDAHGPLDEGGEWDYELQGVQEVATMLAVRYDTALGIQMQSAPTSTTRVTLSLTLVGTAAFCLEFRRAFSLAAQ